MGMVECTVHINRVRPLLTKDCTGTETEVAWAPPLFDHEEASNEDSSESLSEEPTSCQADENASSTSMDSREPQDGHATVQRIVPLTSPGKTSCVHPQRIE